MGATMTDVVIRELTSEDIDSLVGMETAHQPTPWTEGIFGDELNSANRAYFAAFDGVHLLGYGGVMVTGDEAHITNLLVGPDRRGEGLGRRILVCLVDASLGLGARHLTLEVRSKNAAAMALYRRFGLAPVGVRPGYYGNDDAVIMWAHDIDGDEFCNRLEALR